MKKITLFILIAVAVASCKKDGGSGKLPDRMVITGTTSYSKANSPEDMARLNGVVKHLWDCGIKNFGTPSFNYNPPYSPFYQRDTINAKFLFWNVDVVDPETNNPGALVRYGRDMVYRIYIDSKGCIRSEWSDSDKQYQENFNDPTVTRWLDTVAYTPNAVFDKIKAAMNEALVTKDYSRCYDIFDKEMFFIPITGAEYRELERRGLN